jgi:hypothetical protein
MNTKSVINHEIGVCYNEKNLYQKSCGGSDIEILLALNERMKGLNNKVSQTSPVNNKNRRFSTPSSNPP